MKRFKDWDGLDWLAALVIIFMLLVILSVIFNGVEP